MVDRVATRFGLVARLADRVADLTRLGFPAWLADRIAIRLCFVARLANGVANFSCAGFRYVFHAIDNAIFTYPVPARFVTSEALLLILDAVHRFHNGVRFHLATWFTTAVTRDTAEACLCFGWDKPKR
jgi:hypothetical protein